MIRQTKSNLAASITIVTNTCETWTLITTALIEIFKENGEEKKRYKPNYKHYFRFEATERKIQNWHFKWFRDVGHMMENERCSKRAWLAREREKKPQDKHGKMVFTSY
jgi:hypothetical protein